MITKLSLGEAQTETVIKHSRFIAFSFSIAGEEDAAEKIKYLRKKYYDCTHVCYAYVADEKGLITKSSDDGEPSGTAGQPILSVINGSGYTGTLIAVVRYFGGTKLGVGGLVKAYTDAAKSVEEKAEKVKLTLCRIYTAETDYTLCRKLSGMFAEGSKVLGTEYGENVKLRFALSDDSLLDRLQNAANGKLNYTFEKESYIDL